MAQTSIGSGFNGLQDDVDRARQINDTMIISLKNENNERRTPRSKNQLLVCFASNPNFIFPPLYLAPS